MSADPTSSAPPSASASSRRPRRSPRSEGEAAGDDYFVLDLDSGRYYSLGDVGGFVWRRMDGRRTLAELAAEVVASFAVSEEEALSDVLAFTRRLDELDLLAPE